MKQLDEAVNKTKFVTEKPSMVEQSSQTAFIGNKNKHVTRKSVVVYIAYANQVLGTGKLSITELAQDVGNESEISVGIERAAHTVTAGMQQLVVAKKSRPLQIVPCVLQLPKPGIPALSG